MRVGVIQSSFIPWRGYFDFIASVDVFIFYDDVQYSKGSWRNRNRIRCHDGVRWMTVPVLHRSLSQLIADTEIDDSKNWRLRHSGQWQAEYAAAPFLHDVLGLLGSMGEGEDRSISQLNIRLIKQVCSYLDINTPMLSSSELDVQGHGTDRLIKLLKAVGGETYLSGPSADAYLDKDAIRRNGIRLEYKSYDYAPYPQLFEGFEGAVTVLDLIANCGPDARNHIRSRSPDVVIIE